MSRKRRNCNEDQNDELQLYNSFEEATDDEVKCVLCGHSVDEPMELGMKVSMQSITVHHFCLV